MKKGGKTMKAVVALDDEPLVRLSDALRQIKNDPATAWMPIRAMRKAVREGKVPARRTSKSKNAWYYVKISDLLKTVV
jgi:hypothetical protein